MNDRALDAWLINERVTRIVVAGVPTSVWGTPVPGIPRKTIRNIAAHLHNSRCMWMKSLGVGSGVPIPEKVDPKDVGMDQMVASLAESGKAILKMIKAGINDGGRFPGVSGKFIFGAMPVDAALFADYAIAHEAHHRGQILIVARILGDPVPKEVIHRMWQWSTHLRNAGSI